MTEEEYSRLPGYRSTYLKTAVSKSAKHAHFECTMHKDGESKLCFDKGIALHTLLLEPEEYDKRIVIKPEFTGVGSQLRRKIWKEDHKGITCLSVKEEAKVPRMVEEVKKHPFAMHLMGKITDVEKTYEWLDPLTSLKCKCRVDLMGEDFMADIKSTQSAKPENFLRSCKTFGYDLSAFMYQDGIYTVDKVKRLPYYFIVVESEEPHDVIVCHAGDDFLEQGMLKYRAGLDLMSDADVRKQYDGYARNSIIELGAGNRFDIGQTYND